MKTVQLPLALDGRPDAQTAAWYLAYVCHPNWPESTRQCMSLVKSALVWVSGGKTQPEFSKVQPVRVKPMLETATRIIVQERLAAAWIANQRFHPKPSVDKRHVRRTDD